jgi:uncharacterized protein DUF1877
MPIICRLLQIPPEQAESLVSEPDKLDDTVKSAGIHSGVYRYWQGIEYLLARHRPESPAAKWLSLGQAVSIANDSIPAARVLLPPVVAELHDTIREIEPDALAPHYDAAALDEASIYPRTWVEWEETFDPLGQVLEHYSFLQYSAKECATVGDALVLYFVDDAEDC